LEHFDAGQSDMRGDRALSVALQHDYLSMVFCRGANTNDMRHGNVGTAGISIDGIDGGNATLRHLAPLCAVFGGDSGGSASVGKAEPPAAAG
jgi:hypothetical protein